MTSSATSRTGPRSSSRTASRLAVIDRLGCGDERSGAPRLHLDEEVAATVAHDEVDLSESAADVARHDLVAHPDKLTFRDVLTGEAEDATLHTLMSARG